MKALGNILILLFAYSCSSIIAESGDESTISKDKNRTFCTILDRKMGKFETYELGDLPCLKYKIEVSPNELLEIEYVIKNKDAEDIYERGYQILKRIKNGKIVEIVKLRRNEDAYWNDTPFVRIRKQKYLADLDGDGDMEFAIFPFSPGSAVVGTVRIFSLKRKIILWGKGRYQFEGDTHVQLGCPRWSKFRPDDFNNCY